LKDCVDVCPRSRRSNGLLPSFRMKPAHPRFNTRQRRNSVLANQLAVHLLFGVCDLVDALASGCWAKPSGEDRIITLAERRKKLLARDRNTLMRHRVTPGSPMELLRVDQSSIHVPKNRPASAHTQPTFSAT